MFIRLAHSKEYEEVANLVESAFGQHDEALLVERLRADGAIAYEWVATQADELVGHLVLSKLVLPEKCLALAPVSVAPVHQREGIGSALINAALELAEEEDWVAVFVLGDPAYYHRFGFDVAQASSFDTPYPSEFTGVAVLDAGGFAGLSREIIYAEAFSVV